jgi:hypothetical protein
MAVKRAAGAEEWLWLSALGVLTLLTTVAAFWVGDDVGIPTATIIDTSAYAVSVLAPIIIIGAATVLTLRAAMLRVESPLGSGGRFVRSRLGSPGLAAGTLAPLFMTPLLLGAFEALKQVMPMIAPFAWDRQLPEVGLAIFRVPAWRATHALFGAPLPTLILDRIYTSWIPLLFCAVFVVSMFAPREIRARFFLSFAAAWVLLGLVCAYLFSSAGPCYAGRIGSPAAADYAPLMLRLHAIDAAGYHLGALEWQDYLWKAYVHHRYGFGLGISAFPSMHNAISFLYVLAAWKARPWVRALTWAFALCILVGSVHLGWHYIADGLFAWPAMALIWWGAGAYLRICGYEQAVRASSSGPALVHPLPARHDEKPELLAA